MSQTDQLILFLKFPHNKSIGKGFKSQIMHLEKRRLGKPAVIFASQCGAQSEAALSMIDRYGLKRTRMAIVLSREQKLPIECAIQMTEDCQHVVAARRHPVLGKLITELGSESALSLKKEKSTMRLSTVMAGSNAYHKLLGLSDFRVVTFPTKDDLDRLPALAALSVPYRSEVTDSFYNYSAIVGAFGHLEIGIVKTVDRQAILVTNGQARKRMFDVPSAVRNRYKDWYQESLFEVRRAAIKIGINCLLIPTNDLVNDTLLAMFNHTAPSSVLNTFYDGFAANRGGVRTTIEVTHGANGKKLSGDFWILP